MKVIYVAGPYRADGENGVWENILQARRIARELWKRGWVAICPHANTFLMGGPDIPDETFLAGDLEILRRCDAVLMLAGWEVSRGAKAERNVARNLGLPIYYDMPCPLFPRGVRRFL